MSKYTEWHPENIKGIRINNQFFVPISKIKNAEVIHIFSDQWAIPGGGIVSTAFLEDLANKQKSLLEYVTYGILVKN